jgi:hypothetical protein
VLCCPVLCYDILCSVVLCCVVLCSIVLYCVVLCSVVLCCVLSCHVLFCFVLLSEALYRGRNGFYVFLEYLTAYISSFISHFSVIIYRHEDNRNSNTSKQEIFQMKQSKADELNDYAVRSAYPAISYTVKKPSVDMTEIQNRKKITDFGRNEKTESSDIIRQIDRGKQKVKNKEENEKSSSIKQGKYSNQNNKKSQNNSHSQNQNQYNYRYENGVLLIDITGDSDGSIEIIEKEKSIEKIEFSGDDFNKSNLSQGPRTQIPRGKRENYRGVESIVEGGQKGEEDGGGDNGIEREKGKDEEREKRKVRGREKLEKRNESVKEVEKVVETFSSRIIMMEDPPHLLQRLFNSERGSGENKNSINYR